MGRAGFEAWPLSRLLTVSSFGVDLCGLYNRRSMQNLLQKSPACERHLPLRLAVVSPRFVNYIIVRLTFPDSQHLQLDSMVACLRSVLQICS